MWRTALSCVSTTKGIQGVLLSKLDSLGASMLISKTIHYTINPRVHGFLIKADGAEANKEEKSLEADNKIAGSKEEAISAGSDN